MSLNEQMVFKFMCFYESMLIVRDEICVSLAYHTYTILKLKFLPYI